MRKKGNVCDYVAQRDHELAVCFRRHLREAFILDLDEIFRKVSRSPASRFFISESRAYELVRRYEATGNWNVRSRTRLAMMAEIYSRVERMRRADPTLPLQDAVYEVVGSPAPAFYLTPRSCRTILYAYAAGRAD
ncbi:MAG: hypothetical protein HDR80_05045 [Bacteroides sp.]|nr:hypothetical protein [Bacteroides sp.]